MKDRERTAIQDVNGNSKKVYINFVYKPIRDDDKNIRGVLAIGYDVSNQAAEKQKLEELEERARMAIESAGLGTFWQLRAGVVAMLGTVS